MFVGLNPSTASPDVDDPTVRKCWQWAKAWGFGSLWMLNAFAYIATDPAALKAVDDPVGPENDEYLVRHARSAALVVAAWGTRAGSRGSAVRELLEGVASLHCLGTTDDGSPSHPLYLPKETTKAIPWTRTNPQPPPGALPCP